MGVLLLIDPRYSTYDWSFVGHLWDNLARAGRSIGLLSLIMGESLAIFNEIPKQGRGIHLNVLLLMRYTHLRAEDLVERVR